MSDLEARPEAALCEASPGPGPRTDRYPAREVPLGGVRGVYVQRSLPQRDLPTVGAWCFLDHFGSTTPRDDLPPDIDPHPHIGLQTVTWPFDGQIRHRDSVGSDVRIEPGQLNLMTSGHGIAHSEYTVTGARPEPGPTERGSEAEERRREGPGLIGPRPPERSGGHVTAGHGLQLWIALPEGARDIAPHFEQHRELPVLDLPGLRARVLIGALAGVESPATAYTPIVGADMRLEPDCAVNLPLTKEFEYALLVVDGELSVAGEPLGPGTLLYLGSDRAELPLSSATGAHAALIGGEPLGEDLVMWWNFVARSHDEIVEARNAWESHDLARFPDIAGHTPEQRIPAPPLPGLHLKPRKRRVV